MTSVARAGGPAGVDAVIPAVVRRFVTTFGYDGWEPLDEAAEAHP